MNHETHEITKHMKPRNTTNCHVLGVFAAGVVGDLRCRVLRGLRGRVLGVSGARSSIEMAEHGIGFEALRDECTIHATEFGVVGGGAPEITRFSR